MAVIGHKNRNRIIHIYSFICNNMKKKLVLLLLVLVFPVHLNDDINVKKKESQGVVWITS